MRGKLAWERTKDPPPDLMIEIDGTRSALARMEIFAAFRVSEVWCYDGERLQVFVLQPDGTNQRSECSMVFPSIPVQELIRFVPTETTDYFSAVAGVRAWVRSQINKPS